MKAIITVLGKDKVGITHSVTGVLVECNVNIEDISQKILQGNFTMIMMVDMSRMNCEFKDFKKKLNLLEKEISLSIKVQREEIFNFMHNI